MKIFLKKISKSDIISVFNLKNNKDVIQTSLVKNRIKFSNHKKWFKKKLKDKNCLFYSIRNKNNLFIGYVRLDFEFFFYKVTIAIIDKEKKKSYAYKSLKEIEKKLTRNSLLLAQILNINKKSIRLFIKSGYKFVINKKKINFFVKLL